MSFIHEFNMKNGQEIKAEKKKRGKNIGSQSKVMNQAFFLWKEMH